MKEARSTKRQLFNSYFTTVISITLVLFLLGIVGYLLLNAKTLSDYVKENLGFDIVLNDNAQSVEVLRLQKYLDASPYVKETKYTDKEENAKDLQEELGEDFVDFLGYNPLMSSIEVKLRAEYANPDSIKKVEKIFTSFPQVKEVYYEKDLISTVNDNTRNISLVLLIFSALLLTISITLINNMIRLMVYSKRFIINTMQLVGATKGFIRRPLLGASIFYGFLGAVIANVMLSATIIIANREIEGFISINNVETIGALFIIVVVLGILLSLVSTYFAVNKYLRLRTNQLYF